MHGSEFTTAVTILHFILSEVTLSPSVNGHYFTDHSKWKWCCAILEIMHAGLASSPGFNPTWRKRDKGL